MTSPSTYNPSFSFTNYQTANPSSPLPADHVDAELNNISRSVNGIINNLNAIQRSDTQLKNQSVGYDQLSAEINLALNGVTAWATAKAYVAAVGSTPPSLVLQSNQIYMCLVAHTSGTFATDLAAGKWTLMAGSTNSVLQTFIQSTTLAAARAALGSATVGDGVFVAANTLAARTAMGVATIGNLLWLSASTSVAKNAMGVSNPNIASARNLVIFQASNTTATVTADEIVTKTAKGGDAYEDASVSYTLNFANIGVANGLDAGAIGASSFYYVYAIANPTNGARAVLASLSATAPTLPSGYTASGLIGVLLTDGSSHLMVTRQLGREIFYQTAITILSNLTPLVSSLTSQSISTAVPAIAKTVSGALSLNFVSSVTNSLQVAGDATGTGLQTGPTIASSTITNDTSQTLNFRHVPLVTAQTMYHSEGNTSTGTTNSLKVTSFEI